MISSLSNPKVKFARSLARKKERQAHRQFVVEGTRLIHEAVRAGHVPALVFFLPAALETNPYVVQVLDELTPLAREVYAVSEPIMRALSETEAPQGLLAVFPIPQRPLPDAPRLVLVLDAVRDPGNTGTILRTAWAAGVDAVLLAPTTADPYNPKVVRAGMGAHFALTLHVAHWDALARYLQLIPRIYIADAAGELDYSQVNWTPPLAVIVGGEAFGPSSHARRLATASVMIPMPGPAESLNVAIATGILLFEAVRKR